MPESPPPPNSALQTSRNAALTFLRTAPSSPSAVNLASISTTPTQSIVPEKVVKIPSPGHFSDSDFASDEEGSSSLPHYVSTPPLPANTSGITSSVKHSLRRPPPPPPPTPATPGDRLDVLTARAHEMSVKITVMLNECFLLELESQS